MSKLEIKKFTLIELLVVLGIVAILASLMLPALNLARDKAKMIACTNNLHQGGISFQFYANDNNGMIMIDWNNISWVKYLTDYSGDSRKAIKEVKSMRYHCPATFRGWDGITAKHEESYYFQTVYGGNVNSDSFGSANVLCVDGHVEYGDRNVFKNRLSCIKGS